MSTTVTYKGNTIATVNNGTKTLKTAGKYMEDDVTLVDVSGGASAISVIDELDENGGTIRHINAVDLSQDTVSAAHLELGYTAHNYLGEAITGTLVPGGAPVVQSKTINITPATTEQSQSVTPDTGYDGLSSVDITVDAMPSGTAGRPTAIKGTVSGHSVEITPSVTNTTGYITGGSTNGTAVTVYASELVSGTYSVTGSGTADVTNYASISVPSGTATAPSSISGTGATVTTGTNTLTLTKTVSVTPNVTAAGYISSGTAGNSSVSLTANVNTRSASDLSVSGATVTVPAGYYSEQATKSVSSMTLPTSASGSASSGYTSKATIGRSTSDQYINIPTGYNASGAYYKVSAVPNGSATAPSTISGTSAAVSTGTNTLTLTKTVSVTPSVTAGYISSGTAGNASVSLTASVTTQAAQTYYPSASDQTISSGRYLTGTQTVKAVTVSGLSAENIASGVTVKIGDSSDADRVMSVTGTLSFQTIYTGSSAPSSSTGVDGDIYIQT